MQLIFQLGCSRLLLNEIPNNLYFLLCTRLKTLRVMEDKVTSFICNLMLNVMYASDNLIQSAYEHIHSLTSNSPQLMVSNVSQKVPVLHLNGTGYEKVCFMLDTHPTCPPRHIWWQVWFPLLHHKPSQGWLSCQHWLFLWWECESGDICNAPWSLWYPVHRVQLQEMSIVQNETIFGLTRCRYTNNICHHGRFY